TALINLGGIYKDLGNIDQALAATLKSLELKPDNPDALSDLFGFYAEGDLPILKSMTRKAADLNKDMLNNLSYIEAISSLGKEFIKGIISAN
ncbi:tetratricopeptide repeat protein, partial [bacterium]|nr:tetratricopeptide repeat protein [bacterium]